jgi:hypothetical protein
LCDNDTFDETIIPNNCWLYVDYVIPGMSTGVIKISYDAKNDFTVAVKNDTKAEISNLYEKIDTSFETSETG